MTGREVVMFGRDWIVAQARAIAIAVLERTETVSRTSRDQVSEEADSPLERWRALVAVAAPSLLDGNDEDVISRAGVGDSSPRHASTTTAMFEQFDRGRPTPVSAPSSTPTGRIDAPVSASGIAPDGPARRSWARLTEHPAGVGGAPRNPAARSAVAPTVRQASSDDRPAREAPPVAESWSPSPGYSAATTSVTHAGITAVVAAVRGWSPHRRRTRHAAASVQVTAGARQHEGHLSTTGGIAAVDDPAPARATTVPRRAVLSSPAHRRPDDDGTPASRSPAPRMHPAATPEAGRLQLAPRWPRRTALQTPPRHSPHPYAAVELTLAPEWPALPPSPLDRDGVAPNRLPAAVASASPGPDAFAARWSAEREAR